MRRAILVTILVAVTLLLAAAATQRGAAAAAEPLPLVGTDPRPPFATVYADKTRVVVDLPIAPTSVSAAMAADGSLLVDYTGIPLGEAYSLPVGSTEIDSVVAVRVNSDPPTARLTFRLARYQRFRVMSLAPSDGDGPRIVVDVYKRTAGPPGDGPPLVYLDPGHGGRDPGAIGVSGSKEKDLNLALGLSVATNLQASGLRVALTRSADVYVDLHARAAMANNAAANLFLSMHHNSFTDPAANGTETYYQGTSTSYPPEGRAFAETMQRALVQTLGLADRGAKTHWATLVVLNETTMTQALVEVGFLSNPGDEARVTSQAGKQAAMWGVANGVREYLQWSTRVFTSETVSPDDYSTHVEYASIRGSDRFDTAIRISRAMFPTALPAGSGLVLAPGETFAEALCGAPLAAAWGGPVLLTPAVGLNNGVRDEMMRLAPDHVVCIGLSPTVVGQVTAAMGAAVTVEALNGDDDSVYDMSYRVAKALDAKSGGLSDATAIVTRGDVFPDAIAVAPLACYKRWPIILTEGPTGPLQTRAAAAMSETSITKAIKVGTYAVLPDTIEGLANLSGKDRYFTDCNVVEWSKTGGGLLFAHVGLATGDKFPDALAAGPYLALDRGVLLLSPLYGPLPAPVRAEIAANAASVSRVTFFAMIEPVIGQMRVLLP